MFIFPAHKQRFYLYLALAFFSRAYTGNALTIPVLPEKLDAAALRPENGPMDFLPAFPRADTNIVTMFGIFDTSNADGDVGDGSHLAPIRDVLQMMFTQPAPSPTIIEAAQATHSGASASSLSAAYDSSITATAFVPLTSPPRVGPGIVLLPTTAIPSSTINAGPTATPDVSADSRSLPPSKRMLILGSIIGGVICIALVLFFMIYPSISKRLCGCIRPFKKSRSDRGISNIADPSFSNDIDTSGSPDHTFVGMQEEQKGKLPGSEKVAEDTLVDVELNGGPTQTSKFSVCSSDYLSASTRDSGATSSSNLTLSTRPGRPSAVTFASPARPPRPPTADSPALSDSVYFAVAHQPYVVRQQPVGRERGSRMDSRGAPKKNLTPSEFFALHVPGVLANLVGGSRVNGPPRDRTVSAVSTKRLSRTGSQHSRTKSAPLLGTSMRIDDSEERPAMPPTPAMDDNDEGVAVRSGKIGYKVSRHRRSRSASGWAYPDRPRSRRVVNV